MAQVSLGKHYEHMAEELVSSGAYESLDHVMIDAMRLLEEQLERSSSIKLKTEIQKGLNSGTAGAFDRNKIRAMGHDILENRT